MVKRDKQMDWSDLKSYSLETFRVEALRLLTDHSKVFHNDGSLDCILCRSLRRSLLRKKI